MKKIIGVLPPDRNVLSEIKTLLKNGNPSLKIHLLSQNKTILDILGCNPARIVRNYALCGALIVGLIYSVFGITAAWCECNLMGFTRPFGLFVWIGAMAAGTIIGGVMGAFYGFGKAEEETNLYIQRKHSGSQVILLETPANQVEEIKKILEFYGSVGIKDVPDN